MKIVVLAGGTSTERDVSISTSKMVCASLRRNGHQANMLDVFLGDREYKNSQEFFEDARDLEKLAENLTAESVHVPDILAERNKEKKGFFGPHVLEFCQDADIVFMGLHGSNGEDGKIQGAFDLLGIRYTGTTSVSSAISMDKDLTKKVLVSAGIPMPKGVTLQRGHKMEYAPVPCVVKPCCGGSSVGVTIVDKEEEFAAAVEDAFRYEESILVEEFVKGREFSVAVLDGKALPVIEIVPDGGVYDYEHKYSATGAQEICPADLPEDVAAKMQRWAEKACEAAGVITYARVDELLDEDDQIYCLEINTLPGMTQTSLIPKEAAAVGMTYDQLTQKIIDVSMKKYE